MTLFDINCSKIFFDPTPRAMKIKTKIAVNKDQNQIKKLRFKPFDKGVFSAISNIVN